MFLFHEKNDSVLLILHRGKGRQEKKETEAEAIVQHLCCSHKVILLFKRSLLFWFSFHFALFCCYSFKYLNLNRLNLFPGLLGGSGGNHDRVCQSKIRFQLLHQFLYWSSFEWNNPETNQPRLLVCARSVLLAQWAVQKSWELCAPARILQYYRRGEPESPYSRWSVGGQKPIWTVAVVLFQWSCQTTLKKLFSTVLEMGKRASWL